MELKMDKKRILIAEDEPHIARLVIFKLEREGFEVTWVKDGGKALESIKKNIPDLVLLDVMMPVKDGFDVLKIIKEDKHFWKIPVIMLTAKGQIQDVEKGFNLGSDDYVVKPFRPDELVARIRKKLEE